MHAIIDLPPSFHATRRRVLVGLASLACSTGLTNASAGTYVALDAAYVYRTGTYRVWDASGARAEPTMSGHGIDFGGAFGWTIERALSVALEGEVGTDLSTKGAAIPDCGINGYAFARVGPRIEVRRAALFARASGGAMWLRASETCLRAVSGGLEYTPSTMRGPYGALTIGLRGAHIGGFVRLEAARLTERWATFTPLGVALGLDVGWF